MENHTPRICDFNPHSHAGSDENEPWSIKVIRRISIHTPTQGVTIMESGGMTEDMISIHTPTQGVT